MSILYSGSLFSGMIGSGQIGTQIFPKPAESMNRNDFLFLLDLMTDSLEQQFITDLGINPQDGVTRSAYADYLEEKGRIQSAQMVRGGYDPGRGRAVASMISVSGAIG